jgi:peroxiredoxin Q/BCP
MAKLSTGSKAPTFSLLDQAGDPVKLADQKGVDVLLYFYPKADTPGCTRQACGLRDIAKSLGDTVVIGISPDTPAALAKFADKYSLNFTLLSDLDHSIAEAYGVWVEKNNYGKKYMGIERSAFLIDAKGVVQKAWYRIKPEDTPTKLLAALGK